MFSKKVLETRPHFGGKDNKRQVRSLDEIGIYQNFILFNVYSGVSQIVHVATEPFSLNDDWCIYYQEIGSYGRRGFIKRMSLSAVSVIPYLDGDWEDEWCILKFSSKAISRAHVDIDQYQPCRRPVC